MAIATTYAKLQEKLANNMQPAQSQNAYKGMTGVSRNTANNLGNYQAGYKPSEQVQKAQDNIAAVQAQRPQSYNSKYAPALDNILQQIQNPQGFKYEFNGDNLFKYYADLYTQKGKQASMDAMGQAAALTGGYGNTYGQQVGTQAYQQYLLNLYDKGLELRDRAYQKYQDDLANQKDAYQLTANADDRAYGMYRDEVGDWRTDLDYATNRADTERSLDYDEYNRGLDYWTGLAQNEASMAEQQRQADLDEAYRRDTLTEQQRQANMDEAYRRDTLAEQIRNADLDENYRRDTLAEQIRNADLDEAYRRDSMDLDENYRRDTLAEQIRNADLDEAYRRDSMDLDEAYRRDSMNLDEAYRRDTFNEERFQYDRNLAQNYAMAILQNGQIPSLDLLTTAGLSLEDAQKLIKVASGGGGGGGKSKSSTEDALTMLSNALADTSLGLIGSGLQGIDTVAIGTAPIAAGLTTSGVSGALQVAGNNQKGKTQKTLTRETMQKNKR